MRERSPLWPKPVWGPRNPPLQQVIIRAFREAAHFAVAHVRATASDLSATPREELRDLLEKCAMTSLNSKLVRGPRGVGAPCSCVRV